MGRVPAEPTLGGQEAPMGVQRSPEGGTDPRAPTPRSCMGRAPMPVHKHLPFPSDDYMCDR